MSTERFAGYVATLGRGPGRSRALTRDEARDAMGMLLAGEAAPIQVGAFLMLLRYRGEDAEEIAGLVEGALGATRVPGGAVELDWPSYGAGRTRGAPWFLLAALALADAGVRVLMHGTNEFTGGVSVGAAMGMLGRDVAGSVGEAAGQVARDGFAYVPAAVLSPRLAELLGLRRLLGLRSPINTVARLLDPAGASAGVDGVFHPPYIETHLAVAERLGRGRLLVLKGGGGEAERNPGKAVGVHLWVRGEGRAEVVLPAVWGGAEAGGGEMVRSETVRSETVRSETGDVAGVWSGRVRDGAVEARIVATIELGALALGREMDASAVWEGRKKGGWGGLAL